METILGLGLAVLAFVVWVLLGEIIAELLRPLKFLYRPPHGALVLLATWVASITLFAAAFSVAELSLERAGVMVVVATAVALIASLTYRDQRREFLGRPPVGREPPQIGGLARVLAGLLAFALGISAIVMGLIALSDGITQDTFLMGAGVAVGAAGAYWLGYAATHGRFPNSAGDSKYPSEMS